MTRGSVKEYVQTNTATSAFEEMDLTGNPHIKLLGPKLAIVFGESHHSITNECSQTSHQCTKPSLGVLDYCSQSH